MSTPAAFLSYARRDDEHSDGHLTELRILLEREVQSITGESSFRIFQDQADVAWGQQWQNRIDGSIDGSLLLIPIISPFFFKRDACRDELTRFLKRESQLGRSDLILPIYFIEVPNFTLENADELIAVLAQRQYRDWRDYRHESLKTPESRKRISNLAREMNEALDRKPTPQELELRRTREVNGRLEELQNEIGGNIGAVAFYRD
jgi:F-box protein 11